MCLLAVDSFAVTAEEALKYGMIDEVLTKK